MKKFYVLFVLSVFSFLISLFTTGTLKTVFEYITAFLLLEDSLEKGYKEFYNHKIPYSFIKVPIAISFFFLKIEFFFLLYELIEKIRKRFLQKKWDLDEKGNITRLKLNNKQQRNMKKIYVFSSFLLFILLLGGGKEKFLFPFLAFLLFQPKEMEAFLSLFYQASLQKGKERGLQFHEENFFEKLNVCDTVILAKTGVVTCEKMELTKIIPVYQTKEEILKYASILEKNINHPIANAIKDKNPFQEEIEASLVHEIKGKGVRGVIEGKEILLGNSLLFEEFNIKYPRVEFLYPTSMIAVDGTYVGTFVFKEMLKKDLEFLFPLLKEEGIEKSILISSSPKEQIKKIASHLSILESYANLTLEDKISLLKNEKRFHHIVYIDNDFPSNALIQIPNVSISTTPNKKCDLEICDGNLHSLLFLKKEANQLKKIEKIVLLSYTFLSLFLLFLLFLSYRNLPYSSFLTLLFDIALSSYLKYHGKNIFNKTIERKNTVH